MSDLLSKLNPQQLDAVIHQTGPAIVLAGAGSGKTTVLTTRASWLIQKNVASPSEILLITFTNKAANEMRHRLQKKHTSNLPSVGTFHSFSARLLRRHSDLLGFKHDFTIYDTDDQLSTLKIIYKEHSIDPKKLNLRSVLSQISHAKNELLTPEKYSEIAHGHIQEQVARIYQLYQKKLRQSEAVDFDDLLALVITLLRQDSDIRQKYQHQFQHVLIDEYQDTNLAQYELTKLLAAPQDNLFVVGDFSQSIYAWRGADYRNMLQLKNHYPTHQEYHLEQNYRSTQNILDAATSIIAQNRLHPILHLWTNSQSDEQITIMSAKTDLDEANQVVSEIQQLSSSIQKSEIAILYRTNAQSRIFEEVLIAENVPYIIVGGLKFYERKEIKDLICYLRLVINPEDEVSFKRIEKLGKKRLAIFIDWIDKNRSTQINTLPHDILKEILQISVYQTRFDPNLPEDLSRLENIEELLRVTNQFTTLKDFLDNVALIQEGQMINALGQTGFQNSVQLMSLHSAKGLEFTAVFLVGLEEGLLPHSRSLNNPEDIEEERRLCYVGITRAKNKLYLSYAKSRYNYGSVIKTLPSRFLADLPNNLASQVKSSSHNPTKLNEQDLQIIDAIIDGDLDISSLID